MNAGVGISPRFMSAFGGKADIVIEIAPVMTQRTLPIRIRRKGEPFRLAARKHPHGLTRINAKAGFKCIYF